MICETRCPFCAMLAKCSVSRLRDDATLAVALLPLCAAFPDCVGGVKLLKQQHVLGSPFQHLPLARQSGSQ